MCRAFFWNYVFFIYLIVVVVVYLIVVLLRARGYLSHTTGPSIMEPYGDPWPPGHPHVVGRPSHLRRAAESRDL